jgi:hypothetical protein
MEAISFHSETDKYLCSIFCRALEELIISTRPGGSAAPSGDIKIRGFAALISTSSNDRSIHTHPVQ